MAICKFGPTVIGIRKTVAGLTFSAGSAGACVRPWVPSSVPDTVRQTAQRSLLATLAVQWRALDYLQRAAWSALAAAPPEADHNSLGVQYYLSAMQWHNRVNTRLILAGLPYSPDPPVSLQPAPPSGLVVSASVGPPQSLTVDFDPFVTASAGTGVWFGKLARGAGITTAYSQFYSLGVFDCSAISSLDFTAAWTEIFGPLRVGNAVWIRAWTQTDDGVRSTYSQASGGVA